MKKNLNFRDIACPKPVMETKKALSEGGISSLEIIVDNIAAKENIIRFLNNSGCKVEEILESESLFTIIASVSETLPKSETTEINSSDGVTGKTYIITSFEIGRGDDTLGSKLMSAFLFTLSEYELAPKAIFFLNGGVKHCLNSSDNLVILRKIADRGTEITACGTCLDFYGITNELAIGQIGNLYDLVHLNNSMNNIIYM